MIIGSRETWDAISQVGVLLSAVGTTVLARKNKWGWVIILASQPFWFITAVLNHQVGVFVNTVIFTCVQVYGMYKWFAKKDSDNPL